MDNLGAQKVAFYLKFKLLLLVFIFDKLEIRVMLGRLW